MTCESWEFTERGSEWVLCSNVRVHLEMLIEKFANCRCSKGRNPYCRCKIDPWTDEQTAALIAALNGKIFIPAVIESCIRSDLDLNAADITILRQVARHGRLVQIWQQSQSQ